MIRVFPQFLKAESQSSNLYLIHFCQGDDFKNWPIGHTVATNC